MPLAIIYSDKSQECQRAVALFQSMEEKFIEYLLDRDFTQEQFIAEFGKDAIYPQVAIGYNHIGSLKETLNYYKRENKL